ncbi:MAG: ATP-grasp domain-containing protein [Sporolactobacillus sp.]
MKILVEGIGSMVFSTQLAYYQAMHWELVGIDITNHSFGLYSGLKPYIVPKYSDSDCFDKIKEIINHEKIDLVFPTINEGLKAWSAKKNFFKEIYQTEVILSDENVIDICTDKWKTYQFFVENEIPTPKTSLSRQYALLKPRIGRGSTGIYKNSEIPDDFSMDGYISQEIVEGEEYTIDALCNLQSQPIYIIPRRRLATESGVSTQGVTVYDSKIINFVKKILSVLKPIGIVNLQCFKNGNNIVFIEINPRIAGGSSLSFASSDNWFKAIECFVCHKPYQPQKIRYDNYMFRYYKDLIVSKTDLL